MHGMKRPSARVAAQTPGSRRPESTGQLGKNRLADKIRRFLLPGVGVIDHFRAEWTS
jgi:hypothetical protein